MPLTYEKEAALFDLIYMLGNDPCPVTRTVANQALDTARAVDTSKDIMMQLGQAYELWSEQETGSKQKSLTRKAIEVYKQVKSAEAKAHIAELQERLR